MADKHNRTVRQARTTTLFPLRSQMLLARAYALILSWNETDSDLAAKVDVKENAEVVEGDGLVYAIAKEQEPTQ